MGARLAGLPRRDVCSGPEVRELHAVSLAQAVRVPHAAAWPACVRLKRGGFSFSEKPCKGFCGTL